MENTSNTSSNTRLYLIIALGVMGLILLYMMGAFTFERGGSDIAPYSTGQALTRCKRQINSSFTQNPEHEDAFQIGVNGRSEELSRNRFRIKSWYEDGNGQQRYTCNVRFGSGPDDYTVDISSGW